MEQKYILGIIALTVIAILGISIVSAFGLRNGLGFMNPKLTDEEKAEMQEKHEAIRTAIENGDYETWKSLMEERIAKMRSQITKENFNSLREQHQRMSELRKAIQEARESGNFSKVQELKKEYGFESGSFRRGMKAGFKMGTENCPFAK